MEADIPAIFMVASVRGKVFGKELTRRVMKVILTEIPTMAMEY